MEVVGVVEVMEEGEGGTWSGGLGVEVVGVVEVKKEGERWKSLVTALDDGRHGLDGPRSGWPLPHALAITLCREGSGHDTGVAT